MRKTIDKLQKLIKENPTLPVKFKVSLEADINHIHYNYMMANTIMDARVATIYESENCLWVKEESNWDRICDVECDEQLSEKEAKKFVKNLPWERAIVCSVSAV